MMTLKTFLDDGYLLRFVQYQVGSPLLAVTVDHYESPKMNDVTFQVALILGEQDGSDASSEELPVLTVGAAYLSPLITAVTGDVFDAALYEMA
jgi:hypothetical protein